MKTLFHRLVSPAALLVALPFIHAADDAAPPAPKAERAPMRVLAGPERERRVIVRGEKGEKEKVAFLGVEASPASPALAAQLGLAKGTGLVIGQIAPKSPADGVLQQHDVLLKLDDQILIEPHQLAVLIRTHREGDEVTLTYVRAGKQATAKVKLGVHEVPKVTMIERSLSPAHGFGPGPGDERFQMHLRRPDGLEKEEWNRVLSLLQRSRGAPGAGPGAIPPPARVHIDHGNGPGFRAMSINTSDSNLAYSDDEGSLDLTIKDGVKRLVAKDARGEALFSGPVTTPEERKAMPPAVRERLEKLEGMHDLTFQTDGDFRSGEAHVVPLPPSKISLPPAPPPEPARRPRFF